MHLRVSGKRLLVNNLPLPVSEGHEVQGEKEFTTTN